jgi:hypothetical protein
LTLDLAGRIPTSAEARAFVESTSSAKRSPLVDRLLSSPDFAFHYRNELDTLLMSGQDGDGDWREYLLDAVRQNRPWSVMFREMMLGQENGGEKQPSLAFLMSRAKSVDDMTNDTSRIFFGVNVSCAKCHDHPLVADWQQDHFYGMLSFFDRTYRTKSRRLAEKYDGEVKFKTTAGEEKQARFMYLTGRAIDEPLVERSPEQKQKDQEEVKLQMKDEKAAPPRPPEFSPRAKLVELALAPNENQYFARSIVNRTWARYFGRGLVDPLDQMHSENPPSHPELLDWLARDMVEHNYDVQRLIRGIVLSDTYARSSRWDGDGAPPAAESFAVAAVRPLSPRQYALSLLLACSNPESFPAEAAADEWARRRESLEAGANGFAGQIETPGENFQVSVDEALLFSNNDRISNDFLRDSGDRLVGHLKSISDRREAVSAAFWAVCSRPPHDDELAAFEQFLSARSDNPVAGLQQIVWALLAGPELRFNY